MTRFVYDFVQAIQPVCNKATFTLQLYAIVDKTVVLYVT